MKILLLGKNGQVGWELQRALQPLGEVIALDRSLNSDGLCGDIVKFTAIEHVLKQVQPDIVVNATAYTAVDKAESEQDQADLINHLAIAHLAEQCKQQNALLIHYSTDYVFNGTGTSAWAEDDVKAPINYYGRTKRDGEIALENSQVHFINFRTCWVYGTHGHNFIKTMLKLAQTKEELGIIQDQVGVPTGAELIADVTAQVLRYYTLQPSEQQLQLHGHYHLAPTGETTWYDYAQYIFEQARQSGVNLAIQKVNPIATSAYPTAACRPLNSRLNTQKLQKTFKLRLPEWQQGVAQVMNEILKT
ncbi:dTDP-4-dehydrorhamnose reductase [Acinetobacter sp. ANC 7201]|uniref:dTDP-4-dehydrorhamnose reductase n=1 Tax=Acinetobacter sp. ANC 7201 TaxID=3035288 RepID=UPI0027A76BCF|nr:dTDP-4-dehydrorhamnose reductase [Acinetobacter sp. ANC 7201]WFP96861.1 dTDP-4-dehydrorhamnose reductase [Acinetobacter sp. ANC 7201]